MPTRIPGESSMTYIQKLIGREETPPQWKSGMKETMKPEDIKNNVKRSLISSVKEKARNFYIF